MQTRIQLRAARIPGFVGYIAAHYWFVILRGGNADRWEIWQNRDEGGQSWAYLHRNLKPYDQGVGNGPSWIEREWEGADADRIADVIEACPKTYAGRHRYHYWPGPNSNTFVQWVLNHSNCNHTIGRLGIGKGYLRIWPLRKEGDADH